MDKKSTLSNKEQIKNKLDAIVNLYHQAKEINDDKCFQTMLISFNPEIQLFGNSVLLISKETGIPCTETDKERWIEYRDIRFYELRDLAQEVAKLKEKLSQQK